MLKITVKIDDAKLRSLIRRNPEIVEQILRRGANTCRDNVQRGIFEGRPEWKELSERRISEKGHEHILIDRGDLVRSIFIDSEKDRAICGTNIQYAEVHELGTLEPKVPRRPFLVPAIQGAELQEVVDSMINHGRILYTREI